MCICILCRGNGSAKRLPGRIIHPTGTDDPFWMPHIDTGSITTPLNTDPLTWAPGIKYGANDTDWEWIVEESGKC